MVEIKSPWKSWTLWANGAMILVGAFAQFLSSLPPEAADAGWVGIVAGVVNVVLRFKTTSPIR